MLAHAELHTRPQTRRRAPTPDKRTCERYPYHAAALLFRGANALPVQVLELSSEGMRIRTTSEPALRQFLHLEVVDPSNPRRPIGLTGMAVRSTAVGRGYELGIQLYANGPDELRRWARLVALARGKSQRRKKGRRDTGGPSLELHSYARFSAVLTVRVGNLRELEQLYNRNRASGSVFLRTQTNPPIGSEVLLKLVHPRNGSELELIGLVVRKKELPSFNEINVQPLARPGSRRDLFFQFVHSSMVSVPNES